jgi:hypothetical protein
MGRRNHSSHGGFAIQEGLFGRVLVDILPTQYVKLSPSTFYDSAGV